MTAIARIGGRGLRGAGIAGFVVLLAVALGVAEPRFLSAQNLTSIAVSIAILAIAAAGQTIVIIGRQIDLSVGSIVGLSAMAAGIAVRDAPGIPVVAAIALAMLVGLVAGLINGAITACGVPAIITTLGTLSIYRGLVFIVSDSRQVDPNDIPPGLTAIADSGPLGVPWLVPIAALVVCAVAYWTRFARTGRQVAAMGSNPDAAATRGVNVSVLIVGALGVSGLLAGLGGAMYVARFGTVNPADAGLGFELSVIAAVVIGGTNIFGGSGSVLGTILGCVLVGIIANGLTVTGVSGFWQPAIEGVIILLAVVMDANVRRRFDRRHRLALRREAA